MGQWYLFTLRLLREDPQLYPPDRQNTWGYNHPDTWRLVTWNTAARITKTLKGCILYSLVFVWVGVWTAEWQFGHTQVIQITIRPLILKNINNFYFEISGQIAIQPFSMKKVWKFLNSWMAIQPYTSHSADHTEAQTQAESQTFKTHLKGSKIRWWMKIRGALSALEKYRFDS